MRAFKTAIFGTPAPIQRRSTNHGQEKEEKGRENDTSQAKREGASNCKPSGDEGKGNDNQSKDRANLRPDSLASPTKGILLTPGTAATRRKTVSFGVVEGKKDVAAQESTRSNDQSEEDSVLRPEGQAQVGSSEEKPRQSKLTKTLIELSKQKVVDRDGSDNTKRKCSQAEIVPSIEFHTDSVLQLDADTTLDLNQPRSTSGQHWKGEYDQYHRRSNREMKTIIKYGQNVRSFAAKKDTEATRLSERLRKQMAKMAEMETKMTALENELSSLRAQESNGESDRGKSVDDLVLHNQATGGNKQRDTTKDVTNLSSLSTELESFRRNAKAAEDQTTKLEKENAALKLSLARVKNEMMSYETRRQAREDRMKKRETKHRVAREECEKKLARLEVDHEELLRTSVKLPVIDMKAEVQSIEKEAEINIETGIQRSPRSEPAPMENKENSQPSPNGVQRTKSYISPRKKRLQKPAVDIWTLSSSQNGNENSPASKEPSDLPPSSVKRDVQRTLKEIDQNLVPNQNSETTPANPSKPQPSPDMPVQSQAPFASAVRRMHDRKSTMSSPRPSMISLESSPAKLQTEDPEHQPQPKASTGTVGRSASLLSGAGSRTSTMGSGRVSMLPAERVSAAKQRLARRMEKRKQESVER